MHFRVFQPLKWFDRLIHCFSGLQERFHTVEMEWVAISNNNDASYEGTIVYPDLSTDACGDYEVNVKVKSASIPDDLRSNIVKTDGIFQKEIRRIVGIFEKEFVDSSFKK